MPPSPHPSIEALEAKAGENDTTQVQLWEHPSLKKKRSCYSINIAKRGSCTFHHKEEITYRNLRNILASQNLPEQSMNNAHKLATPLTLCISAALLSFS